MVVEEGVGQRSSDEAFTHSPSIPFNEKTRRGEQVDAEDYRQPAGKFQKT
jgi:hypothetical protein